MRFSKKISMNYFIISSIIFFRSKYCYEVTILNIIEIMVFFVVDTLFSSDCLVDVFVS